EEVRGFGVIATRLAKGFDDQIDLRPANRRVKPRPVTAYVGQLQECVGQIVAHDVVRGAEHDGALERVLELAHVAGPVVSGQVLERFGRDTANGTHRLTGEPVDEVARERGNIVAP